VLGSFAIIGLLSLESSRFVAQPFPSLSHWQAAIMLMTFAFVGIESAMIPTGEMSNPRRDVPFALGTALSVVALLYVLIQIACIGSVPDLGSSQRPVADAAERVLGIAGAWVVGVGALVTMLGTLFAVMLTGSRLPFAFAERGQVPEWLAVIHPRFKTPHASILVTTSLAWLFTLYSSFFGALTVTAVTRLVGYVTTCIALIVLRRRSPHAAQRAHFVAPAGPLAAAAGAIACVWLILAAPKPELITVGVIAAAGIVFGGAYKLSQFKQPGDQRHDSSC
jgi:APA family basic amino acid/polyamine antiporter